MESLQDNKALLYTLVMSSFLVVALSLGLSPSFSLSFDIVEFDFQVSRHYTVVMLFSPTANFSLKCRLLKKDTY